jgi:G:T/U-mismatch repair DNA glycosylase
MTTLDDLLEPGLTIVFCGTAAGLRSAALAQYYAGPGNQFWKVLAQVGLTPRQLSPHEYGLLPQLEPDKLFVAPSTSGAARGSWDVSVWHQLAGLAREK